MSSFFDGAGGTGETVDDHEATADAHGDRAYTDAEVAGHVGDVDPHGDRAHSDAELAAHGHALADLSDVDDTGAAEGHVLTRQGDGSYALAAAAGGGGGVFITSPAVGEYVAVGHVASKDNTTRFVEGRVYYLPLVVAEDMTVDAVGFITASSDTSGGTLRAGLYTAGARNMPGTLLEETAAVDTAAGDKVATLNTPQVLTAGLYYVGIYAEALLGSVLVKFWGSDNAQSIHIGHRTSLGDLENVSSSLLEDGHTGSTLPADPSPSVFSAVIPFAALRRSA